MKQAKKKSLPSWNTHTHTHSHKKIEKREKVRGKERGGVSITLDVLASCPELTA